MRLYVLYIIIVISLISCERQNAIVIKGSDTEVNLAVSLAETFYEFYPDILLSVSGGGSGLGIASLINGNTTIANSSRQIKASELALFKREGIDIDSVIFAQDAIAFVVSQSNNLDSISLQQLADILSGQTNNWKDIDGTDSEITVYGRQSNSGTYDYVKDKLHISFSSHAKQMNGNAQILESLKNDASGIGYVGAGYVMNLDPSLKILKVYKQGSRAHSPLDAESIENGNYLFQRPLFQYFRSEDYKKIEQFLKFEQSKVGQEIIRKSGYYPSKISMR